MGKGRTPCCDKAGVKRGPWSEAEDLKLISFIHKHGHSNWRALPKLAGLSRCGKSCRLRWVNYLRPDLRRGNFTMEEEETIIKLHESLGNKWSKIASHFPGRTDNEIKNVWNTHLKKRLKGRTKSSSNHSSNNAASSCTEPSHDHPREEPHVTGKPSELPSDQSSVHDENMLDVDVLKDQTTPQLLVRGGGGEEEVVMIEKHVSGAVSCRTSCTLHSSNEHNNESVPAAAEPSSSSSTSSSSNNADDFGINIIHDQQEQEVIEILFEPNLDLWDLLDGTADYNSTTTTDYNSSTTTTTFDAYHGDTVKEEDADTLLLSQPAADNDLQQVHQQQNASTPHHQVGSTPQGGDQKLGQDQINGSWRWWFGYLENELGLDQETTTHDQNYQTAGHYQNNYDQVKKMSAAAPQQQQPPQPPPPAVMMQVTCSNNSSSSSTTDQELLMLINQDIHEPVESYFNASWEWPSSPNHLSTPII